MNLRHSALAAACALTLSTLPVIANAAAMPMPVPSAPAPAYSNDNGFYAGAFGGPGFVHDIDGIEFKAPSWQAGAQVGYKIGPFRVEGEFAYINDKFKEFDIKLQNYIGMFNGLVDLRNDVVPFVPYLGVGIGGIHFRGVINGQDFQVTDSEDKFAMQGIIGASVPLSDTTSLFLDYRYIATTDHVFDNDIYQTHTVNFGANVRFDI
jgi:opacity protein-like surface antigen